MLHSFVCSFLIKNVICVCVPVAGHTTRLTGQSVGVGSLHHVSLSLRDWTHITSFGSKRLYPLSIWSSLKSIFALASVRSPTVHSSSVLFDVDLLECQRTWSWGLISFLALYPAQSCNLVTQPRAGLLKDFALRTPFCPINHEEIF